MTKRLDASAYQTDKSDLTHYLQNYETLFAGMVQQEIRLLELGVDKGGSLLMWRDYFDNGVIVGLDTNPVHVEDPTGRIRIYQGRQEDTALLSRIAKQEAPAGFDIIIDDCSHIGRLTQISFWHLFQRHLKPGGIYAIEDWGTGYWGRWVDGKDYGRDGEGLLAADPVSSHRSLAGSLADSRLVRHLPRFPALLRRFGRVGRIPSHDYGMVGFVKELVDECGIGDITHPQWTRLRRRQSRIRMMQVSHGHVIVFKP